MNIKRTTDRRRPNALRAAGLVAGAIAVVLQLSGALAAPEQETVNLRTRQQRAERPRDVVVVAIDEASFGELRHTWPLPRSLHARAIDRLRAAGAREIVYDVQFTEPTRRADDLALFRSIGRARGAVLATTGIDHGRTDVLGGDQNLASVHAVAAASGLPIDPSGVISRVPFDVDGLPSIAVAAARRAGHAVSRGAFDGGGAWIHYAGPPGTVPTVRFSDLVFGRVDPALLRGRIAVVGGTVPSLQDVHATPAGTGRMMSGPEIQANAIQSALDGFPLRGTPGWLAAALAALLGFAAPFARRRTSVLTAVLVAAAVAAAWALGALVAFTMGLILPVAAPLAAIALGAVAMVVSSHLDESLARRRISRYSTELEALVRERTRELRETQLEVVHRLAQAAELRDDHTGGHIERIGLLCGQLAQAAGMSRERAELVAQASVMHDVGKIGIPDRILLKPGKLDDLEWQTMKAHTTDGARLLAGSGSDIVRMAEEIALTHHERWDGTGYPAGLRGEDIPLAGRICAICDVFDALVSARPYKPAWPVERSLAEIRAGAGTHFDPALVEPFIAIVRERIAPQALAA